VNYFRLYQDLSLLVTLFLCAGLVWLASVIYYSVRNSPRPGPDRAGNGEHGEPGIPLVLKLLYLAVVAYIAGATIFVAVTGAPIG